MKNRAILLLTVFLVLYAGFNLPSCESEVEQIAVTEEHIKEAMALAAPIQTKIEEYYAYGNQFPRNNKELSLPAAGYITGKFVRSIRVQGGFVFIKFNKNILNGGGFKITPSLGITATGKLEWKCINGNIETKYFENIIPPCLSTATDDLKVLMLGIHQRNMELIEQAIDAGTDINGVQHGETPLMRAISNRNTEIVKYIIEQGADTEQSTRYYNDRTPLMIAVKNSSFDVVKILVENGADVNAKHKSGKSVIDFISLNKKLKKYLYENGVYGAPEEDSVDVF